MVYSLKISLQAQADTIDTVDYYDNINPSLGDRFLEELITTYQKIKEGPELYSYISSKITDKFRDVRLTSFPHVVIYEICGSEVIVAAVLNTYKRPFL